MAPKLGRWNDLQTTSTAKSSRNGRMWCDRSPPWAGPRFSPVRQAPVLGAGRWFGKRQGYSASPILPDGCGSRRALPKSKGPDSAWTEKPSVFGGTWARKDLGTCLHSHQRCRLGQTAEVVKHAIHHQGRGGGGGITVSLFPSLCSIYMALLL